MQITETSKNLLKTKFSSLDVSNLSSIVSNARKGVKARVFYDFAATIKMPEKDLASIINLSSRTISNYTQNKKTLAPIYSEHLLKLINLYQQGEEIFGNIDEFNLWLKKPFLNNKLTPLNLMITTGGVDLVAEELDKLAQGYPV
ncbi:MAG: MbcA/ParS/Xre antitoxin family protein [Bacteroidota bacterium]|nr:MbcA/ParS/Xre antitoxin family protein [Bacteroidota bacterium]